MTEPSTGQPLSGGWAPDVSSAGPEWEAATPAQRQAALEVAVHTVWALSGRQFGVAEVLLAPWVPYVAPALYARYGSPWTVPGAASRYRQARSVLLPGPVADVLEVRIGDVALTEGADWIADPDGRLVRVAGGTWPAQDLYAPIFTVRYVRGVRVPVAANTVAGIYAAEWVRAQAGSKACKLPARTREVARQGVTVQLADPDQLSRDGLTGVAEVDAFLNTVNPPRYARVGEGGSRIQAPPLVWTPELARHRVLAFGPVTA